MRGMQAGDDLDAGAPQGSLWQRLAPAPGRPWPERAAATLLFTVAYLAAVAAVVWIQGYTFVYGNVAVSVPQVLALTDPTLFRNDLCHQSVLAASPRIYINGLVALTAKLGVTDVPGAYFLWFVVSVASYVAGCLAIGTRVSSRAAGALLAFLGVAATKATIGSVDILHQHRHFEPAMLAMGFSVWGIYFVLGKRFTTGFAMFGVAALFQFLVGFIPGALIAPALGVLALKERNAWTLLRPMLPFAAGLGAVYLPMALAGATSTKVPDDVFVFLYAHVRNPHHVSPAAWPPVAWQELVLFSLGGVASAARSFDQHHWLYVARTAGQLVLRRHRAKCVRGQAAAGALHALRQAGGAGRALCIGRRLLRAPARRPWPAAGAHGLEPI